MMKKILFPIICLFLLTTLNAQNLEWAKSFGAGGSDIGNSVAVDAVGNVYTVGSFSGTVDFDPGVGVFNLVSSTGGMFISKLDANGNFVWAKNAGGAQYLSIAVDASANVHIFGSFTGTIDTDPSAATFNLTSMGSYDVFISKLDFDGNFLWAKSMGGMNTEYSGGIAVDASGNVYTTGNYQGTADFNPGGAVAYLTAVGGEDVFISKLNSSGDYVWGKSIGGSSSEAGAGIAVDGSSNVYITGNFVNVSGFDFDPGTGTYFYGASPAYLSDIFILKLNSSGGFVWANRAGSSGYNDSGTAIYVAGNSIYVTGTFESNINFSGNSLFLISAGSADVFVFKVTSTGTYSWVKSLGGTGYDDAASIVADGSGNVYTTGFFSGTSDFDPGASAFNLTASGGADVFISKLNSSGNFSMANKIGSTAFDDAYDIAVTSGGSIYTTGHFGNTVDFAPDTSTVNLTSMGGDDIFIQKLSTCIAPYPPTNTTAPANLNICYNTSTILSGTGTSTLNWYSAPVGGTNLGSGDSLTTAVLTDTTNFYVQVNTCTNSPRIQITVIVSPPIVSSVSSVGNVSCSGFADGTAAVSATGGSGGYTYLWSSNNETTSTVTGLASGTYTCTITDANACMTPQSVTITEPTALNAATTITPVSCNGGTDGSATILGSGGTGAYSYLWSNSATTATSTGLVAGTYSCTITDANSCTATISSIVITEPSPIDVSTAVNSFTISANATGVTYQWINCSNNMPINGETNQAYTATANGDYAVIINDGGCLDTSACVNITGVGIIEMEATTFSLYPNPTNNNITLQFDQAYTKANIELINTLGQTISNTQSNDMLTTISLPQEKGIYFVRITIDGKSSTQKVVKQ